MRTEETTIERPHLDFLRSHVCRIIGTVSDGTGAAIPSASVNITNVETGRSTKVQTDARRLYQSFPLSVGTYRVDAEAAGFKKAVRQNIELQVQQTVVADLQMQIGDVTEQIEVFATTPLVSTTDASQVRSLMNARWWSFR